MNKCNYFINHIISNKRIKKIYISRQKDESDKCQEYKVVFLCRKIHEHLYTFNTLMECFHESHII